MTLHDVSSSAEDEEDDEESMDSSREDEIEEIFEEIPPEEEEAEEKNGREEDESSGSTTDYDSSNVWSDEEDEAEKETKEAAEAAIMNDFHRSLDLLLDGKKARAKKILKKILKQPSVAKHKTTKFFWDNEAADNSHLNKMGRVFVGAHKNLANIEEENAIEHYLQVVGIAPCNDEVWFDLGQKLVQKGDLEMAIYAFEQTSDWRAEEALMSTHFLKKNYKTCLQYVTAREEREGCFKKGNFLKNRIASISQELKEYVQHLFGETSFDVEPKYEKETMSRLCVLESKIVQCMDESREEEVKRMERMDPIRILLSADQSAWDIMIVFCDLFDRIQAYSQVLCQRIFIEEWECRDDKLAVENAVEGMVDDVVAVESTVKHLVNETTSGVGEGKKVNPNGRGRPKKTTEGKVMSRRVQKGEKARIEESSCEEEERPTSVDSIALREPTALEDVATYYLDARPIRPLREGASQAPSRMTATPGSIGSEEDLLTLIRESLYEERYLTVFKALEYSLYSTVETDCLPPRSSHQSEILLQVYRRWTQCSPNLLQSHHLSIHSFIAMYDEPLAMDYCMRVVHSSIDQSDDSNVIRFSEKRDLVRFVHKRVEMMNGNAEESMKWLKFLTETIDEEEAFNVVGGVVSRDSMSEIVEKRERAGRIRSLKQLSATKKWEEIVSIVESDSQWSSVEDDKELSVRTRIYTKALTHMGRDEKAGDIINRMLYFLLSQPSLPASIIGPWIKLLNSIDYSRIPSQSKMLPSLGYSLLRLTEHSHLARDWKLWRVLHQVIKKIEESRPDLLGELFSESLMNDDYNRADDYDELPLRSLRFLVHAHDRMSTLGVCGQNKGAFLKYSLSEFRQVMEREAVKETLQFRKMHWLMSNVQAEVYQLLHCACGKYSKKKRAAEDHETGLELGEGDGKRMMQCAVALSIPNPIPEYDDKGASGVDLIDLITHRFPSLIRINERRQGAVNEMKRWIERGPVWKGELKEGETIEEKMRSLLVEWPHSGVDSKLESVVFYLIALHYHRQSKHDEARQFAEYFLSSTHVGSLGKEVTKGAWVILSYASVERMFKLYDDDILQEIHQHIRPLRVAIELSDKSDATVPFLLAQTLYQVSTRLSRYFRKMSSIDPHQQSSIVGELRNECVALFEKVIEVAPGMQESNQSAWEFQWMSYFFLAKLHLKGDNPDVVKAVDGLFEAAAALQMGGTVYVQRIPVKNQKNIEPVEVHYHMYSTVWKYITRCQNPPFDVLVRLRSYTDAMSKHGVVKPSAAMDLYELEPAISETVHNLSFKCSRNDDEEDVQFVLNNTMEKVELIEELKTSCKEAFKLVTERFPHRKAFHRLAQIAVMEGDLQSAHNFIFKKIFPRKKMEDLLESVIDFTSTDIDRSDSLSFHVTRSLRLGLAVSVKLGEASFIMAACTSLAKTIIEKEESYVLKCSYMEMVKMCCRSLSLVLSSHPSQWTKPIKTELLALHKTLIEVKDNLTLGYMRSEVKKIVAKKGGLARLESEVAIVERKPQQRKRKVADDGSGVGPRAPPPKMPSARPPITTQPRPSTSQPRPPIQTTMNMFTTPSLVSSSVRPPSLSNLDPTTQMILQIFAAQAAQSRSNL